MPLTHSPSPAVRPSLEALCEHAQRLVSAGDLERAVRAYQLACLQHPSKPASWIGLGLCQKHMGKNSAAELALTFALAFGGDSVGLRVHRAECRTRLGRVEAARHDLQQVVSDAERTGDTEMLGCARSALNRLEPRSNEVTS